MKNCLIAVTTIFYLIECSRACNQHDFAVAKCKNSLGKTKSSPLIESIALNRSEQQEANSEE